MNSPAVSKMPTESEVCQSPGGMKFEVVLKEAQVSPPVSTNASPRGEISREEIDLKMEKALERRRSLREKVSEANREIVERSKLVCKTVGEKRQEELEEKRKAIQEKLDLAEQKKLQDIENIKDRCSTEHQKVERVLKKSQEEEELKQLRMQMIENKMQQAELKKQQDLEQIRDRCQKEEQKVEEAKRRAALLKSQAENQENIQ